MSAIINRTPTGRLVSLIAEIKYLKAKYNNRPFELKDIKFNPLDKVNQLMFFPWAVHDSVIGIYDPYLDNPLSPAKFHLTQSTIYDTQKSKSASECLNALEALGWVSKVGRISKLTSLGHEVADTNSNDVEFINLIRSSLLGYGVFIGFLYKCSQNLSQSSVVRRSDIDIGYQNTNEFIKDGESLIPLSTGSTEDTKVRTRSALFAWAISGGFALPTNATEPKDITSWYMETMDIIKEKHWSWSKLKIYIPADLFSGSYLVSRPLNYQFMTKSTKALREKGQQDIRNNSLRYERIIKNRRFAIVYCLAIAAQSNISIDYESFLSHLFQYPELFVVDPDNFTTVMMIEKDIAIISGIPFTERSGKLMPLTKVDINYLKRGAPNEVTEVVDLFFKFVIGHKA